MMRTFFLMIAVTVVGIGCGESETSNAVSTDGGANRQEDTGRPTVALPDDLPSDIPIYPGSRPVYAGSSEGGIRQSPQTSIQLHTTDSVDKSWAFYVQKLEEHSWEIAHRSESALNANKGPRNLNLTIVALPNSPGTVAISLVFNQPDASAEGTQRP